MVACPAALTIKAINTIMTKRIWISRVASEILFQSMQLRCTKSV